MIYAHVGNGVGDDVGTTQPAAGAPVDGRKPGGAVVPTSGPLPTDVQAELAALVPAGEELRARRHAEATRKAYLSDFAHFADRCAYRGVPDLPELPARPDAVYLYLTALVEADNAADYKVSTVERRLSAIK